MKLNYVKGTKDATSKHFYNKYDIEGFERRKILMMVDSLCQSMDKISEIRISYPSDPDNRRASITFDNCDDFLNDNVDLVEVDLIIVYGEHAEQYISAGIGLETRSMTISAGSMELEQNYFNDVSTKFKEL